MANWANPTLTSTYTNFLSDLKARDEDLAKMFDGQTVSNVPTAAIRWSSSNNRFEKWSGSAWGQLSTGYAINITGNAATVTNGVYTTGNQTIGGSKTFSSPITVSGDVLVPASSGFAKVVVGHGATGNQFSYIDLVGAAGQDYGLRISRGNTGTNANTTLEHIGNGLFRFVATDSTSITFEISGIERGRITNLLGFLYGTTNAVSPLATTSVDGFQVTNEGQVVLSQNGGTSLQVRRRSSDGSAVLFYRDKTFVGSISVTTSATAYNTSSDYRLKENVAPLGDAVDQLLQLKPCRFNFKVDPTRQASGFLAHEAAAVVPEAVTGEKDAVDADGNPIYQGIDQSKLVPLLVAAVQELAKKLDSL